MILIGQAWDVCSLLEPEVGWVGTAVSAPPPLQIASTASEEGKSLKEIQKAAARGRGWTSGR